MKVSEILIDAKSLVEKGWTQGAFVRNKLGTDIKILDENFKLISPVDCSFCTIGAINFVLMKNFKLISDKSGECFSTFLTANKIHYMTCWNDSPRRNQDQVVQAFENAINYANELFMKDLSCD